MDRRHKENHWGKGKSPKQENLTDTFSSQFQNQLLWFWVADALFQINYIDMEEETDLFQTWNIVKLPSAFVSEAPIVWASGWKPFLDR